MYNGLLFITHGSAQFFSRCLKCRVPVVIPFFDFYDALQTLCSKSRKHFEHSGDKPRVKISSVSWYIMQQKILIDRLKERSLLMTVNRMYINEGDSLNSFHGTYCLWDF